MLGGREAGGLQLSGQGDKVDISIMCRHMMPKLSFSRRGSASTLLKQPFTIRIRG